jgi:hypothetical protein
MFGLFKASSIEDRQLKFLVPILQEVVGRSLYSNEKALAKYYLTRVGYPEAENIHRIAREYLMFLIADQEHYLQIERPQLDSGAKERVIQGVKAALGWNVLLLEQEQESSEPYNSTESISAFIDSLREHAGLS